MAGNNGNLASPRTDHDRLCQGREYTCTCGYEAYLESHVVGWKYDQIDWKFVRALCQAFSTRVGEGSYDQFMPPVQQRWLTGMKAALIDATAEFSPLQPSKGSDE